MTTTQPGTLFTGVLRAPMRAYLQDLFTAARQVGYSRIVEPASGPFTACQMALHAGYVPAQLDASDVSLFAAILAHAIDETPLDDLELSSEHVTAEDLASPASACWALAYVRALNAVHKQEARDETTGALYYYRAMVRDLQERKDEHVKKLTEQIGAMHHLRGFHFRQLDVFAHLAEAASDPKALIFVNLPTVKGLTERLESAGDLLTWKKPVYPLLDPKADEARVLELMQASPALWVVHHESEAADLPAIAAFGLVRRERGVAARTMNAYLISNRPAEVDEMIAPRVMHSHTPLPAPTVHTLPVDHEITRKSRCELRPFGAEVAYWRALWLHNFRADGSRAQALGVFVDGYLVGILGFDFETEGERTHLTYHIGMPGDERLRWQRLVIRLAMTRTAIELSRGAIAAHAAGEVRTTMFSPHPSNMAVRGLMKIREREPDKRRGFKLSYAGPVTEDSPQAVWRITWDDEDRWRRRKDATPG